MEIPSPEIPLHKEIIRLQNQSKDEKSLINDRVPVESGGRERDKKKNHLHVNERERAVGGKIETGCTVQSRRFNFLEKRIYSL